MVSNLQPCRCDGAMLLAYVPKVILLYSSDGVHLSYFTSDTFYLDSDMSTALDDLVLVVGKLRWCSVAIKLDIRRYHLLSVRNVPKMMLDHTLYLLLLKQRRSADPRPRRSHWRQRC